MCHCQPDLSKNRFRESSVIARESRKVKGGGGGRIRGHCSCASVLRIKRDSARARDLCFSRSNSVTLVAKTISIRYISKTNTVTPIFYFSI